MMRTVRTNNPTPMQGSQRQIAELVTIAVRRTMLLLVLFICSGLLQQSQQLLFAQQIETGAIDTVADPTADSTVARDTSSASSERGDSHRGNTQSTTLFLPLISQDFDANLADRMGFGARYDLSIATYPEIRSLKAGWYVNWGAASNAARPSGIEYVPMVRMHQTISCGNYVTPDRNACPYVEPYAYTYSPSAATITALAQAKPGLIWLLGNEMDRLDWEGGGQDEMLPELYAVAYHELYQLIKAADPTAKIAIGGIIQATPLRMEYLTKVWDTYLALYEETMPVDIWNVHAFIVGEFCQWERPDGGDRILKCYGAGVPPGATVKQGAYINEGWKHIDRDTFDIQIRAFRTWMKDRGQQEKPLIVTEYGVLFRNTACSNGCPDPDAYNLEDPNVVHNFMLWTFDYFMDTKDCALGYTADECRLVQRWAWFSLEDVDWDFNPHTVLFDKTSKEITAAGRLYREHAQEMLSTQP